MHFCATKASYGEKNKQKLPVNGNRHKNGICGDESVVIDGSCVFVLYAMRRLKQLKCNVQHVNSCVQSSRASLTLQYAIIRLEDQMSCLSSTRCMRLVLPRTHFGVKGTAVCAPVPIIRNMQLVFHCQRRLS